MKMDEYDKQEEAITKRLEKLAKKSGSSIVKAMVKEEDPKIKEDCMILHDLFDECLDQYESGEMTLAEAIDEFASLAKQI